MRNLISLVALFSITIGNVYSQIHSERFDTIIDIDGGSFHFHYNSTQIGTVDSKSNCTSIINSAENERKIEERQRMIKHFIDSTRMVLFTKTMELTKSEATVFWPVYKDYQDKLDKIVEKRKIANTKLCDPYVKYDNREYLACINIDIKSYKEEALLKEQYFEKFKTILNNKLHLLYRAEYMFTKWIYSTF
jgi:hypothetical protein